MSERSSIPPLSRRSFIVAGAAMGTIGLAGLAGAATLDEIKARGFMTVATEDDYQPFEFTKDGTPTGYDIELLQAMEATLPFKVKQDIIPWTGILPGVSTGKYDAAITAILVTQERMKMLDFCSPVAETTNYYMKRANDARIGSVKDLNGMSIGVEAGSAMLKMLPQLEETLAQTGGKMGKVVTYQGYPEAYQDLATSRLDVVVNTQLSIASVVKQRPGVFAMGQAVAKPVYIAWAVQKGNAELLGVINGFLAKARADGTMAKLQDKWFGLTFNDLPVEPAAAS